MLHTSLPTHLNLLPSLKWVPTSSAFMPQLFLPYCKIWNKKVSDDQEWNFYSCNQIMYFVLWNQSIVGKYWDESGILTSIPRGVGLISQSVHVRRTWGACLEMHVTRPKLRLIRLGFRGRPVSDVCNSFPRDSWCQYLLRTGDPKKLKILKTSGQHAILMDSGILLQLLHFILKGCF